MSGYLQRRYAPHVTAPDGRRFSGLYPHQLGATGEAPYIAALATAVGGIAEVTLPAGRADVATDTDVFEVEPIGSWRHGAQQAFAYGAMSGLRPNLAIFGPADYLPIYLRVRDQMLGLTLWVWSQESWKIVSSRQGAPRVSKAATSAEPLRTGDSWLSVGTDALLRKLKGTDSPD